MILHIAAVVQLEAVRFVFFQKFGDISKDEVVDLGMGNQPFFALSRKAGLGIFANNCYICNQ